MYLGEVNTLKEALKALFLILVDSVSMLGWINRLDCNISYLYALCYKIQWIHFNLLRRYVHECSFVLGEL